MARRRARGFTLVEILIALGLSGVVAALLLMLTRGQLLAYQMNDAITRAQQNSRAGMDFLEQTLRRACGGLQAGSVGIDVGNGVAQTVQPCLKVWDGATVSGGSFTTGTPSTDADAVEVIYGTGPFTQLTAAPSWPDIQVADTTGFAKDDYVLVTNFEVGGLFQVTGVSGTLNGKLTLSSSSPLFPNKPEDGTAYVPAQGDSVLHAKSVSIYRSTAADNTNNMLMYDPDGMFGTAHSDAQPLVEGAVDFQVAVGIDTNGDGLIGTVPDEWAGNVAGELPLPATPWEVASADPQLRQIRVTLLVQTPDSYSGGQLAAIGPYEDRTTYPAVVNGYEPRYRALTLTVAPRVWNLTN